MSPQAEVWLPKGVSEKDLENLLKPIGGRIDKFQELKPIPVEEISPSSMATFLEESHPSLEFGPVPIYPAIFSKLRGLSLDEQEKLLVDFYSQKVEAFPNGAELGRFLARINNISWFQPKSSQSNRESLEKLCHQALSRLNFPNSTTLRIIKEARRAAWDATRDATRGAEWIVAQDLMPQRGHDKGNPFESLMEIYGLGYWPIGIVPNQDGEMEFVVFIPSIQKTA